MSKRQAFSVLFALLFAFAEAQPLVLRGGEYMLYTDSVCRVWPCEKGKSNFSDALKKWQEGAFVPFSKLEKKGKFERGRFEYWIVLEVKNASRDSLPLFMAMPRLKDDSVWQFSGERPVSVQIAPKYGQKSPFPYWIPVNFHWSGYIGAGESDTFLIKYYNFKPAEKFDPFISDARVHAARYFLEKLRQHWFFLVAFGAALAIFVYAMAMWRETHDEAFGWYAAYCAVLAFIAFENFEDYTNAINYLMSWTNWDDTKIFVHTAFLGICYAQFFRAFFKKTAPMISKISNSLTAILLASMVIEAVLLQKDPHLSWIFYYWLRLAAVLVALFALIFVWRTPGRPSRFIAYGVLCLAFFELISDVLPNMNWTSHVSTMGVLLDLFFFTFALAARQKEQIDEKARLAFEVEKMALENQIDLQNVRLRAAEDIHDEIGNRLAKISLGAQVAVRQPDLDKTELKNRLFELEKEAQAAAGQLREIVFSINPDFDLFDEMQAYFREQAADFWAASSVVLHFDFEKSETPTVVSPDAKRQLLLLFKEAQTNAAKHAEAKHVWLTFKKKGEKGFVLEVRDDGRGFVLDEKKAFSNGLRGMKRRVESIGATFFVSSEVEKGTTVRIEGTL